ncbi:hypothetical protein HZC30_03595 [Candidatus Woesearchaeota archaeon]|nr:hypothetical protein [Candidatus Woesearchaeota archaeon]
MAQTLDDTVAEEVISAYRRRGKGSDEEIFVDNTRNGAYLEINPHTGEVRELTRSEYLNSPHQKYHDGR